MFLARFTNFLSQPIPGAVWDEMKIYQASDFRSFVEEARRTTADVWCRLTEKFSVFSVSDVRKR
jgi:hypothetical protein